MISVEFQLDLLKHRLKHFTPIRQGEYVACCASHKDNNPSLSISVSDTQKVLLHCFSHGCSAKNILRAVGLGFSPNGEIIEKHNGPDLTAEDLAPVKTDQWDIFSWPITKTYVYSDDNGMDTLRVIRRDSDPVVHGVTKKAFFQQSRNEQGRWVFKVVSGTEIPPYNLNKIMNSSGTIYIVEGEKAAEYLGSYDNMVVTTNPGGAGKWNKIAHRLKHYFTGRNIVILVDSDEVGRAHGIDIALDMESLGAASIKVVDLWPHDTDGKDIVDWLEERDIDMFYDVVLNTPSFQLDPSTTGFRLPCGANFESLAHPDIVLRGRDFLVPGLILTGSLCVLAGGGGAGKSSLCGHIAARVSQGKRVFGLGPQDYTGPVPRGNVIWVSREEGVETELLPRLISEGAALERIFVLRDGMIDLDDPDSVRALLSARKPKLVILDPLTSYLGGDENNNKEIRKTLEQLLQITHELQLNTAYIGLVHINKPSREKKKNNAPPNVTNVLGSVGIPNLSRSTLMVNPSENGYREMRIVKANFRANRGIMRFNVTSMDVSEAQRRIDSAKIKLAGDPKRILSNFASVEIRSWVSEDNNGEEEDLY